MAPLQSPGDGGWELKIRAKATKGLGLMSASQLLAGVVTGARQHKWSGKVAV